VSREDTNFCISKKTSLSNVNYTEDNFSEILTIRIKICTHNFLIIQLFVLMIKGPQRSIIVYGLKRYRGHGDLKIIFININLLILIIFKNGPIIINTIFSFTYTSYLCKTFFKDYYS